MNIVIAEIIAKNFKVGDVVTSVIVRDLDITLAEWELEK